MALKSEKLERGAPRPFRQGRIRLRRNSRGTFLFPAYRPKGLGGTPPSMQCARRGGSPMGRNPAPERRIFLKISAMTSLREVNPRPFRQGRIRLRRNRRGVLAAG